MGMFDAVGKRGTFDLIEIMKKLDWSEIERIDLLRTTKFGELMMALNLDDDLLSQWLEIKLEEIRE